MIERVDHIGIAVHSIEEGRLFYEALGLEVSEIEDVPQEGVRVAMIRCGDTRIELIEPTSENSPVTRFLERHGPGLHHLCFGTSEVRKDDGRLREAGFALLREQPSAGAGGSLVQFVHPRSAGGVLVELSESRDSAAADRGIGAP